MSSAERRVSITTWSDSPNNYVRGSGTAPVLVALYRADDVAGRREAESWLREQGVSRMVYWRRPAGETARVVGREGIG